MRISRWMMVLGALIVIVAGTAWYVMRGRKQPPGGQTTEVVARRDLSSSVTATGIVRAQVGAEVRVGSRVSGRVERLYANVGEEVQAGQVIALLDDRDLQAKVDRAQADVQATEARWREASAAAAAQPEQSAAAVAEGEAAVAAAEARLQQAKASAESQPALTESGVDQARRALAVAQTRLDQARATASAQPEATQARIQQAEADLRAAEESLARVKRGARVEEIAGAEANVRQAEARLREADANLRRAEELYAKDYVAAQEVDRRRTERDVTQAEVDAGKERVALLKTQTLPEELSKAQAEVDRAQAAFDAAKSEAVQDQLREHDVTAAVAEVRKAEAALEAAEAGRSEDEVKDLEVDGARGELAKARAGLRNARAGTVQNELKRLAAEAARDEFTQAQAALRSAEAELSYTRIASPVTGIVASVATQEGETVSAGLQAPTFVTIIDLLRLEVCAYVDETDIGKVKVGQDAVFTVDAYAAQDFTGRITSISPKALIAQNVVEYEAIIAIDNVDGSLKPDMTATVTIFAEQHEDVLCVPNKAIRREAGQKVVYVLENGAPVAQPIKTGARDGHYTEVLSGVEEGARVLVGEPRGQDQQRR